MGRNTLKTQASFLVPLIVTAASSSGLILFLTGVIVIIVCAAKWQHRSKLIYSYNIKY